MKFIIGFQGKVVNIVGAPPPGEGEVQWLVEDDYPVNVGDDFDHRNATIDGSAPTGSTNEVTLGIYQMLQRHEDAVRKLNRALRGTSGPANNSANAQGLPQSVDTPDLTTAQFREFAKAMIP